MSNAIEAHLVAKILSPKAQEQYRLGKVAHGELAPYVAELALLSKRYIAHEVGTSFASPITSPMAAKAYALYYTPINAAKVSHLLSLLAFPSKDITMLDVGCGPGTAGLATLTELPHKVSLTCVERSHQMRDLAESMLVSYSGLGSLSGLTTLSSIQELPHREFDLIIAANVLAEMSENEARLVVERLALALTPGGYLMLVEPGQQLHTRRLMGLRDYLLERVSTIKPLFPCTHDDLCPMLKASATDWCHGELEWQQPRLHSQLDSLLGFNKHRIKFSGFIFQRSGDIPPGVRVLTPPRKTNAGVEALVCGKDVYGLVRVAKRNRNERTRAFEKAEVFDRLLFSSKTLGDAQEDLVVRSVDEGKGGSG